MIRPSEVGNHKLRPCLFFVNTILPGILIYEKVEKLYVLCEGLKTANRCNDFLFFYELLIGVFFKLCRWKIKAKIPWILSACWRFSRNLNAPSPFRIPMVIHTFDNHYLTHLLKWLVLEERRWIRLLKFDVDFCRVCKR